MSDTPETVPPVASRRSDPWIALLLGLATLVVLVATSRDYAMVWDEGHTVRRDRTLAAWFGRLARPGTDRAALFSPKTLERYWPFSREEPDGHPPFYALIGLAGWKLSRGVLDPLTSYRFGPMVVWSVTVGLVYLHLSRTRGRLAAATAAGTILTLPQAFSLAHYAHYDAPMACFWLLAQIAFVRALDSRRWIVPFGLAVGLAGGTKFTGLFAAVPAILFTLASEWVPSIGFYPGAKGARRVAKGATRVLLLGGLVAVATLYVIQPPWWVDPFNGPKRFVVSNLTRDLTKPIPTFYLGQYYPFSLPWHNTLVLTAVSVPIGVLILAAIGMVSAVARRPADPEGRIWVLSWATLMVVRALPNAPGHDSIRLFLPSVLSLCALAGIGAGAIAARARGRLGRWVAPALAGVAIGGGAVGIVRLYPYTLSYYNEAVGGLAGAERAGFEVTYYWDTLGREFFDWLDGERRRRPVSLRFPSDLINLIYQREWGVLPEDVHVMRLDPEFADEDYVLQRRKGFFYPYDWWLERNARPIFVVRRQGVDLLRVYSHEDSVRAFLATRGEPMPEHLRN